MAMLIKHSELADKCQALLTLSAHTCPAKCPGMRNLFGSLLVSLASLAQRYYKEIFAQNVQGEDVPGANLLQITWEHMMLLPAEKLVDLRDALLCCLGQHWQCMDIVRQAEDMVGAPLVSANGLPACLLSLTQLAPCNQCRTSCG